MTFTILARDPDTGHTGVATGTGYFAAGDTVPWARPGIGAVATQALTAPEHGPHILDRLADGAEADEAMSSVLAGDQRSASRQVAVVDAAGRIAAHTGDRCIRHAGHVIADDHATLANLTTEPGLPEAMSEGFAAAPGSFPCRLLAALEAGRFHGGDLRGERSAALLVTTGDPGDPPWSSLVNLRVDDHADPLTELRRLLHRQQAYGHLSAGLNHLFADRVDPARERLTAARELLPQDPQVAFWCDVAFGRSIRTADPRWDELRRRLAELDVPE